MVSYPPPRTGSPARALGVALLWLLGCGEPSGSDPAVTMTPLPAKAEPKPADEDALAQRFAQMQASFSAAPASWGGPAGSPEFVAITAELRSIGSEARDLHLRANAALLLGAMHQERGGWAEAAGAYRRAAELVTDDAGPQMALARALLQTEDYAGAEAAQRRALALDADNLEQYLALGEILVKAGKQEASAKAYAEYEVRRAGLIDGLTLRRDGAYIVPPSERAECALSLASASDVGTAFALLYALESEPEAIVREAIARAMGVQRLLGYETRLTTRLAQETDPAVREAITWALAEIERDPVDTKLDGPPPPGTPGTAPAPGPATGVTPPAGGAAPSGGGGGTDPVAPAPPPGRAPEPASPPR